jgi:hypothetical protein
MTNLTVHWRSISIVGRPISCEAEKVWSDFSSIIVYDCSWEFPSAVELLSTSVRGTPNGFGISSSHWHNFHEIVSDTRCQHETPLWQHLQSLTHTFLGLSLFQLRTAKLLNGVSPLTRPLQHLCVAVALLVWEDGSLAFFCFPIACWSDIYAFSLKAVQSADAVAPAGKFVIHSATVSQCPGHFLNSIFQWIDGQVLSVWEPMVRSVEISEIKSVKKGDLKTVWSVLSFSTDIWIMNVMTSNLRCYSISQDIETSIAWSFEKRKIVRANLRSSWVFKKDYEYFQSTTMKSWRINSSLRVGRLGQVVTSDDIFVSPALSIL